MRYKKSIIIGDGCHGPTPKNKLWCPPLMTVGIKNQFSKIKNLPSPELGPSDPDPSLPSSDHAAAALVEPALGWLVHRRNHYPHLPRKRDQHGLIQHQQARVESSLNGAVVESSPDVWRRWSRGGRNGTRTTGSPHRLPPPARGGVPSPPCHLHVTAHDVSDRRAR
jgi:hypothetical protein